MKILTTLTIPVETPCDSCGEIDYLPIHKYEFESEGKKTYGYLLLCRNCKGERECKVTLEV